MYSSSQSFVTLQLKDSLKKLSRDEKQRVFYTMIHLVISCDFFEALKVILPYFL